jgi:serine/threonine protein kinase
MTILIELKLDYKLSSPLGKGQFARVDLCINKHTGKEYALKSIDKKILRNQPRNIVILI